MYAALDLLACSGPNVQESIRGTIVYAHVNAAFAFVLTVLMAFEVRSLRFASLPLPLANALFILHPAWWVDPWHGDCGGALGMSSTFVSLVFGGLFAWHLASARSALRREVSMVKVPDSPYPRPQPVGPVPGSVPLWMTIGGFVCACVVFMGAMDSQFFAGSDKPLVPLIASIPTLFAGRAYLPIALSFISTVLAFTAVRGWVEGWDDRWPEYAIVGAVLFAIGAYMANRRRLGP